MVQRFSWTDIITQRRKIYALSLTSVEHSVIPAFWYCCMSAMQPLKLPGNKKTGRDFG